MPRLLRDSPLNSIWEGSGNVTALDVLRALDRSPAGADVLLAELGEASGADQRLATAGLPAAQQAARRLAGLIAVTLQAALLVRHGDGPVADAFCASRLGPDQVAGPAAPFGTLPTGLDLAAIIGPAPVTGTDRVG